MNFFQPQVTEPFRRACLQRLDAVLKHGAFINGPEVQKFEEKISAYLERPFVSCNSGTDAIILALRVLGIGRGDSVITTAFTFFATIDAIYQVGAKPILADIDLHTFNIDPNDIKRKIRKNTKAILPVHLFGLACDMDSIMDIAKKSNLYVIEDAAQSFGARYKQRLTGSIGDVGCFSFFPTKNLGGFGDGGGVAFKQKRHAKLCEQLRNHGQVKKYRNVEMGYNSRLDTIQAALLLERLKCLPKALTERKKNAHTWLNTLKDDRSVLALPSQIDHSYNQFSILVKQRNQFEKQLKAQGIPYMHYYDRPVYHQPAWMKYFDTHRPLVNSEYVSQHILSLPIYN